MERKTNATCPFPCIENIPSQEDLENMPKPFLIPRSVRRTVSWYCREHLNKPTSHPHTQPINS